MTLNRSDLLRKAQFPLLLACATYPYAVMLAIGLKTLPTLQCVRVFPATYVFWAVACLTLPGRVRLAVGLAGGAALMGLGTALLPWPETPWFLLIPAGYAALLLSGLSMAAWPWEREIRARWIFLGVPGNLLAVSLVNLAMEPTTGADDALQILIAEAPLIYASFILMLALALLSINRANVSGATKGRQRVPAVMRRRNAFLTLAVLALALVIAMIPAFARGLRALWQALTAGVGLLFRLLIGLMPKSETFEPGSVVSAAPEMFGTIGETASHPMPVMLQRVLTAVVLAALAAIVLLAVRKVLRRLVALLRKLLDRLGRYASAASEDYVDEITDTRDDGASDRAMLQGMLRWRPEWGSGRNLPPRERVRFLFRKLRRRHGEWPDSITAREVIPGDAAGLYERARYSDHDVSEGDAQAFADGVRKGKGAAYDKQ